MKLKLWTIHDTNDDTNDFKLSEGRVDHSKSYYYNKTRDIKKAYHQLWPLIKVPDGQIIWCYTREKDCAKTSTPKIRWALKVPECSIITYIDEIMWNCILDIRVSLNSSYKRDIKAKANDEFPNDGNKRYALEKKLEKEFWENKPPVEELWEKLLLDKAVDGSQALIKHPIPDDWIIEKKPFNIKLPASIARTKVGGP